jgi:hypothetical protein
MGRAMRMSPIGGLNVEQMTRLIGPNFSTANDTNFWTIANSGAGSASTVNLISTVTSGTANSGYGSIKSVKPARFLFANPNLYRGLHRLTSLTAALGNTCYFGACTVTGTPPVPSNGFFFSIVDVAGVPTLAINSANAGAVTQVLSGAFNGPTTPVYKLDTNQHGYEITYYAAAIWFYVDGVLLHTLKPTSAPLVSDYTLNIAAASYNSGSGVASRTLETWNVSILRLGKEVSRPISTRISTNTTTVLKLGSGTLQNITICNTPSNNNTITVYDNTAGSGTVLMVITGGGNGNFPMDLDFSIGLTIVTATGATPADFVVTYD